MVLMFPNEALMHQNSNNCSLSILISVYSPTKVRLFLQGSLESPLIKQVMSDMLGGADIAQFVTQLEALMGLSGDGQLEGLGNLAQLVADVAACVKQDRMEYYDTEEQLETRAQQLTDTYELLAGMLLHLLLLLLLVTTLGF